MAHSRAIIPEGPRARKVVDRTTAGVQNARMIKLTFAWIVAAGAVLVLAAAAGDAQAPRPRARDLGVAPGVFPPGPLDAITDVAGVRWDRPPSSRATTCGRA